MQCPYCEQLRRELGSAAEQEARATLEQRASCFHYLKPVDTAHYDSLQEQLQSSRRRQIELSNTLQQHLMTEHHQAVLKRVTSA